MTCAMFEGALVVRFYQGADGPFPIEVGAAVPGSSLSAIVRPDAEPAALDAAGEESLGVSLLEAEATGLPPAKVCDQLNTLLGGRHVNCSTHREVEAITRLFTVGEAEMEFTLKSQQGGAAGWPVRVKADAYPESVARAYLAFAHPVEIARLR